MTAAFHDAPTAAELIEAVREFLETDVMAATDGRVQFHVRVAARVLAMVERELEYGEAPARRHHERLRSLGVDSDEELVAAIRTGELDDRWGEVIEALRATVADRLAVANPKYAETHDG